MVKLEREDIFKLTGLLFFATAMGYSESAVVVYLRELYYQDGFHIISELSLKAVPVRILITEAGREVATIIMLISLSMLLARKDWLKRFAYFLFAFSIWDITYYVWLFVLIRWPESLLKSDVLFLIPRPWVGPVIAPILISLSFIVISLMILSSKKQILSFKELLKMWKYWVYIFVAIWVIISAFMLWEHRIIYLWNNVIIGI
ncbi:MAG: hypothetical protein E3J78_00850, partial [Candidatus Cloacimonadota bacterium]